MWRRLFGVAAALLVIGAIPVIASASIPDPSGVINACYKNGSGHLRVIDTETSTCGPGETSLSWNQAEPPGLSGYEEVRDQEYVAPGQFAQVTASCSAGKRVLGGGYVIETPTDVTVSGSAPWVDGNFVNDRWTVLAQNIGLVTRQVNVVALCAAVQ